MLLDSSLPVNERLAVLMELLRSNRILIFWDDLDLEEKTGRISDPHLGELFHQMTKGLHSSRAIISSQKVPADASILPRLARNWKLDRLSQAAFLRFMLQDRIIADGYRKGEIAFDALSDLYSLYERDPSKLEQIRSALARGLPKDVDPLARLAECLSPLFNPCQKLCLSDALFFQQHDQRTGGAFVLFMDKAMLWRRNGIAQRTEQW